MTLDRRRFLHLSALGAVAAIVDSSCSGSNDAADPAVARPQLLSMLGPDEVRTLGAHYRAATPSENTADALRSALSRGSGFRIPFSRGASLDDRIRDDFASGRIAVVDGWILSVTEARQCALFSLTPV